MYDSIFNSVDKNTKEIIANLFGPSVMPRLAESSKQSGGADCGLYAIGNATALAFGLNPSQIKFHQSSLCSHLIKCMEGGNFFHISISLVYTYVHNYIHIDKLKIFIITIAVIAKGCT